MVADGMTLAEEVLAARTEMGFTQEQMAKALCLGTTTTLSAWEQGKRVPRQPSITSVRMLLHMYRYGGLDEWMDAASEMLGNEE